MVTTYAAVSGGSNDAYNYPSQLQIPMHIRNIESSIVYTAKRDTLEREYTKTVALVLSLSCKIT
jgi:hypothetical protein